MHREGEVPCIMFATLDHVYWSWIFAGLYDVRWSEA